MKKARPFARREGDVAICEGDVLVERNAIYRMRDTDISWARKYGFVYDNGDGTHRRLVWNLELAYSRVLYEAPCMGRCQFFDIAEMYIMVLPAGIMGVCNRHIEDPGKPGGLTRECLFVTEPKRSVRSCGKILLWKAGRYIEERHSTLQAILR